MTSSRVFRVHLKLFQGLTVEDAIHVDRKLLEISNKLRAWLEQICL